MSDMKDGSNSDKSNGPKKPRQIKQHTGKTGEIPSKPKNTGQNKSENKKERRAMEAEKADNVRTDVIDGAMSKYTGGATDHIPENTRRKMAESLIDDSGVQKAIRPVTNKVLSDASDRLDKAGLSTEDLKNMSKGDSSSMGVGEGDHSSHMDTDPDGAPISGKGLDGGDLGADSTSDSTSDLDEKLKDIDDTFGDSENDGKKGLDGYDSARDVMSGQKDDDENEDEDEDDFAKKAAKGVGATVGAGLAKGFGLAALGHSLITTVTAAIKSVIGIVAQLISMIGSAITT